MGIESFETVQSLQTENPLTPTDIIDAKIFMTVKNIISIHGEDSFSLVAKDGTPHELNGYQLRDLGINHMDLVPRTEISVSRKKLTQVQEAAQEKAVEQQASQPPTLQ